jgi:hypothetical protein
MNFSTLFFEKIINYAKNKLKYKGIFIKFSYDTFLQTYLLISNCYN